MHSDNATFMIGICKPSMMTEKSIGTIGAASLWWWMPSTKPVPKSPLFNDHLFQQFVRPRLHVWGILVHGWGAYVAVSDADTSKGCSTLVDLLVFVLSKLRSKGVPLDKFDFCVQLDNTSSCNKNNVTMAFAACCAHFKMLSSVRLCFLRVGHTHEDFGGWVRGWLLQTTMKLEALMLKLPVRTSTNGWANWQVACHCLVAVLFPAPFRDLRLCSS